MNDSPYGLTASIWTNAAQNPDSQEAFLRIVDELETGTVFLNRCVCFDSVLPIQWNEWTMIRYRCDFLDPALAWTGVKHSGRGVSLSKFGAWFSGKDSAYEAVTDSTRRAGYDQLTRAKSVHMKLQTA